MRLARFEFESRRHEGVVSGDELETEDGTRYARSDVDFLPPCEPSKIIAAGKNYAKHVKEMAERHGEEPELPDFPFFFFKPPSSVIGPDKPIVYPEGAERVDYEGELGVVIGERCRKVAVDEATDYVKGFTCINDVSWRDWSSREDQWVRHKGLDTFCPTGPYIQTEHPEYVDVVTSVNGDVRQSSNTSDMVFSVAELVAEASRYMTLEEGDLVATGTPSGVGRLQPGDVVEVEVESVGTLKNEVVSEADIASGE